MKDADGILVIVPDDDPSKWYDVLFFDNDWNLVYKACEHCVSWRRVCELMAAYEQHVNCKESILTKHMADGFWINFVSVEVANEG